MLHLFLGVDLVFGGQPLDDFHIKTVLHNESSRPRSIRIFTLLVHRIYYRKIISSSSIVVVFTECRRCVYDSGTVLNGYVIGACHEEGFLIRLDERHKLLVFDIFEIFSLHLFEDLIVLRAQHSVCQHLCNVEYIAFLVSCRHLHLDVIHVGTYSQRNVGGQRPRRGGPCQEILVGVFSLELGGDGGYLYFLIALSYFMGSKTRPASRAVRQDLMSFVYHIGLEEFLDYPPKRLNIIVIESDVWVIKIYQISHSLGHLSPHAFICEYGLLTLFIEFFDTVFFNILLAAHIELLFHFYLYWKSVSIPACFTLYRISLHGLVTAYGVLQRSCDDVMYSRSAVGSRRSFIEYE